MKILFTPQRNTGILEIEKTGDVFVVNNESFDFSELPDGATIPSEHIPSPWFAGDVHRVSGELILTFLLPYVPPVDETVTFPSALLNPPDGRIPLPTDIETE